MEYVVDQDVPADGQEAVECRDVVSVLDRIGDKWSMLIIGALINGPARFNALMRAIDGVSHRMLTRSLRTLEYDGLVKRISYPTIPPKVEYELTELGRSLIDPLASLTAWVRQNQKAIISARTSFSK